MKKQSKKISAGKISALLSLLLFVGIFGIICLLSPTRAHALAATAVSLTATDGQQTVLNADDDVSTPTYSWDAETATLTLNGYSGRMISANGDINLHLVGNNTLTMDPNETNQTLYAINLEMSEYAGTAIITAEAGGTLNIVGDIKTQFVAIDGYVTLKSGTVNVDVTTSDIDTLKAFDNNVMFDYDSSERAEINVKIERTSNASGYIYGFYNGLNMRNRKNVEINVDIKGADDDTIFGISNLVVENSGPRIVIDLDNGSGGIDDRVAIDSLQALQLTEGGYAEFNGKVCMYSFGNYTNGNTVTTTPQDNNYIWIEHDNQAMYSNDFVLSTLDGNICEKTVFEYQATPATLKWVGGTHMTIPAGKVDDNFSMNLLAGLRGARSYEWSYWKAEVVEGQLPAGIYFAYQGGVLSGHFEQPCNAGSVTVKFTDKNTDYSFSDNDIVILITLQYGEIAEKDKYITVGNSSPVEMKSDGSGAGWSYDGDTKTLTLNGYNGGPIHTEGELNLHLKGNNTITLTDEKIMLKASKTEVVTAKNEAINKRKIWA